jgi:hypothetical protein
VSNGTFTTATTDWDASSGTTLSVADTYDGNDNNMSVVHASAGYASQDIAVFPGHLYKFVYSYAEGGGAGDARVSVGTSAGDRSLYDSGSLTTATWTTVTTYFTVGSTTETIYINLETTGAGKQYYDNVSLTCVEGSLRDIFKYSEWQIWSGTQPSDPDSAPTGTKLVTINNAGAGITFGVASSGALAKTVGETWTGVGVADGTAGWFRLCMLNDPETTDSSYKWPRLDGQVGTSGAELNFTSTAFVARATQTISDAAPTVEME